MPEPQPVKAFDDDTISKLHQLDAIDESDGSEEKAIMDKRNKKNTEKKKGGFWKVLLWILAILIILLACAAVIDRYLFNSQGRDRITQFFDGSQRHQITETEAAEFPELPADYDREAARDNITDFTMTLDGLEFSDNDIDSQCDELVNNMKPYLLNYLKTLKQSDNEEVFVDQVSNYAGQRMRELLKDDDFQFQSLLNYKDYVRESMMPTLKEKMLRRNMYAIQTELLDHETLERILSEVVPADELTPDPAQLAEEEAAERKAAATKKKADKPAPITSKVVTESKQGFDLIAGFSVNKGNADRLCSQLKAKGCDAYIINRNGLYYVSMGSGASRTEIEAKYTHVKEWYKGDVTIKKW